MSSPVTNRTGFLDLVRLSAVIEPDALDRFLAHQPDLPEAPTALAELLVENNLLTRFQAKHLLAGRKRGLVLGAYRILEPIGRGGTAQVYLAEHRKMLRKVAIKVLPPHRSADREAMERFYREARAVATLDHPAIVKAHDVACEGNIHYLVMEYVEGQSLRELVESKGPVPPAEAARYIDQTLQGLEHAHQCGLIHRDIKPANLLLDRNGNVKILDMGLVKFFEENDDTLTRDLSKGAVLGTADYLSPEQALSCHDVDIRSDIYSLGATFYTLLNGQPPFHGSKLTQKLMDHQFREPPPLHELRPEVPPELCALVRMMMAKKPEDRPQTPAAARELIRPWLTYSPATEQTTPSPSAEPVPARGRTSFAWVLAACLLLVLGLGGAWWAFSGAPSGSEQAPETTSTQR